ncbi:hypothetical protein [Halomarina rubra]|uniref:DUF4345 domain-containing protein n=1 Tax=Halomarina rubra TaxID=2071873 RepID=A0ABD6B124_9EURY|nr:hypothetical protein [Halomarina rubra]
MEDSRVLGVVLVLLGVVFVVESGTLAYGPSGLSSFQAEMLRLYGVCLALLGGVYAVGSHSFRAGAGVAFLSVAYFVGSVARRYAETVDVPTAIVGFGNPFLHLFSAFVVAGVAIYLWLRLLTTRYV